MEASPASTKPETSGGTREPSRLSRIVIALRSRDWLAVTIELIVVTVGVLLAFQIDQWGQDRRQAQDERQFLDRMWRETGEAISENDGVVKGHAQALRELTRAMNAPSSELAILSNTPEFGCMVGWMPSLGYNDTSYQELIASGRLNIVRNPELRSDLKQVAAAQADAVAQLSYARSMSTFISQSLDRYYHLGLDRHGDRTCRLDWQGITKDPIARNAVTRAARFHLLMWERRAYTHDMLARAHNRIACQLHKPDCRSPVRLIMDLGPRAG